MRTALFCLLMILALPAYARVTVSPDMPTVPLTFDCIQKVSTHYDVPIAALIGILAVENGTPGQAVSNANGTWDLGPFQINSSWISSRFEKAGISPYEVLANSCLNAGFAAWLLRQELNTGKDMWGAIGAYHSPTPTRQKKYSEMVARKLQTVDVHALIERINRGAK